MRAPSPSPSARNLLQDLLPMYPDQATPFDPFVLSPHVYSALNYIYFAILLVHVLEWVHDLPSEVGYLFKRKWRTPVKWPYFVSRYFGLLAQLCNLVFTNLVQVGGPVPVKTCRGWLIFQLAAGQILWWSLEYTLVTRLKAFYQGTEREILLLRCAIFIEKISSLVWAVISIPQTTITDRCLTINTPPGVPFSMGVTSALLLLIWVLIYRKQPKTRSSFVTSIVKDTSHAIIALLVMLIAIVLNANFSILDSAPLWWDSTFFYQCSFPILIAILTSANCHMVKNLEGFVDAGDDQTESYRSSVELTSFTALDDGYNERAT